MADYDFQKDLEKSLENVDPKLDKKDVLRMTFKTYVAKLFELVLNKSKTKDRIEISGVVQAKGELVSQFRKAKLAEYQMSVKQYEELFDNTVQEIVDFAGGQHRGVDSAVVDSTMSIDKRGFWNTHQMTDSGIIVSKN